MNSINTENTRLILFHKHPMSARMNFLRFQYGGVCAFDPLPKLAAIIESKRTEDGDLMIHPATISTWGEEQLGLQSGTLVTESEFCETVEVPKGEITIYLAGFKGHEIPEDQIKQHNAKFISLMECVGIAPVEMLLLQKAYGVIMGGQS
jgi:hypothetical protein